MAKVVVNSVALLRPAVFRALLRAGKRNSTRVRFLTRPVRLVVLSGASPVRMTNSPSAVFRTLTSTVETPEFISRPTAASVLAERHAFALCWAMVGMPRRAAVGRSETGGVHASFCHYHTSRLICSAAAIMFGRLLSLRSAMSMLLARRQLFLSRCRWRFGIQAM